MNVRALSPGATRAGRNGYRRLHYYDKRMSAWLAYRVRQLRLERRLSQRDLAALTGLAQPRISEIERGIGGRTLSVLALIWAALDVSPRTFFTGAPKPGRLG
jgi:DNA-binding XRE family transcriptional regulator